MKPLLLGSVVSGDDREFLKPTGQVRGVLDPVVENESLEAAGTLPLRRVEVKPADLLEVAVMPRSVSPTWMA